MRPFHLTSKAMCWIHSASVASGPTDSGLSKCCKNHAHDCRHSWCHEPTAVWAFTRVHVMGGQARMMRAKNLSLLACTRSCNSNRPAKPNISSVVCANLMHGGILWGGLQLDLLRWLVHVGRSLAWVPAQVGTLSHYTAKQRWGQGTNLFHEEVSLIVDQD